MLKAVTLSDFSASAPAQSLLDQSVDGFLLRSPEPFSSDVSSFLKIYSGAERTNAAQTLIARGVDPTTVSNALTFLDTTNKLTRNSVWGLLAVASAAASGYHGYKRNQSVGWAVGWFILGGMFPIVTPVVAVAQGFAKQK